MNLVLSYQGTNNIKTWFLHFTCLLFSNRTRHQLMHLNPIDFMGLQRMYTIWHMCSSFSKVLTVMFIILVLWTLIECSCQSFFSRSYSRRSPSQKRFWAIIQLWYGTLIKQIYLGHVRLHRHDFFNFRRVLGRRITEKHRLTLALLFTKTWDL